MKKTLLLLLTVFCLASCNNNDNDDPQSSDLLVGTWTELGYGTVSDTGDVQFFEYDYFCVTLGRFAFEADGTFRVETFDGPDNNCVSTGVITGTWEKTSGNLYLITILTDSSVDDPLTGEQTTIPIEFPNKNRVRFIYQVDENGIEYEYEEFTRVD